MVKKELSMQKLNKQIDILLDIIVESLLGAKSEEEAAALTLWPIPVPQGMLYFSDVWTKKLNRVLHLIEKRKIKSKEILKAIRFPSRIVQFLWLDAITFNNLSKKEKLYPIAKFLIFLSLFRKKDIFCENGKNILWNKKELEKHKRGLHFFSGKGKNLNKLISTFEAILWSYTELLYWTNHPFGHGFHGSYSIKEGDLVVKEYFDLKPKAWSFSQGLNFSEVEIFEIYKRNTSSKIKLEFFERNIRTNQSIKQDLEKFALKVNGKIVKKPEEISQFLENLMEVIKKGSEIIQALNEQQLIEKYADYYFYAIKPLCDLVKENWHPPKQVRNNIYKKYKEINAVWEKVVKKNFEKTADLSYKQQEKILKEAFDPRN